MTSDSKFGMLRKVLRMLRLSPRASEDVINFIVDLLTGEGKDEESRKAEFPYRLRDDFLSPAELSFFNLLRDVIGERAVLCPKVGLSDLFCVKHSDPGRFRIYTNKIDRKHMDFVLCDPVTMRPFLALELDDRSHKRPDRQERDAFVEQVFEVAGLPLLHVPARHAYRTADIAAILAPYLKADVARLPAAPALTESSNGIPHCPKCNSPMVLRTAKSGPNAGSRFWGCPNYPKCRIIPYTE